MQAKYVDINDLIRILNILSTTQDQMRSSSNPRILAEVTMMKIAQPMFDESKEALIKRIENLEKIIESGEIKVNTQSTSRNNGASTVKEEESVEEVEYEQVKSEDVKLIESSWKKIRQVIKDAKQVPLSVLLGDVSSFNVYDNVLYLIYKDGYAFAKKKLCEENTISYIENVIRETISRSFNIKVILESEVKDIDLEIKEQKMDQGEEILRSIVDNNILEIKDTQEE